MGIQKNSLPRIVPSPTKSKLLIILVVLVLQFLPGVFTKIPAFSAMEYAYAALVPVVTDDGEFTENRTQLHATWVFGGDAVFIYQYAIGTSAGATNVANWTPVGTATQVTRTGLSLVPGQTYYFSVKAKWIRGKNWSAPGFSDGITVVNRAPTITLLLPNNNATFTEQESIEIRLEASDPDSDPLEYQFSIDGQVVRAWSPLNTYNWQTQTGDFHLKTITAEVRDAYQGSDAQAVQVYLYRKVPAPQ